MEEHIIETAYGKMKGFRKDGCVQYRGIPFAKAPVGDLAFRHPQKPEPWEGVYEAHQAKANALQGKSGFSASYCSQDCLYLNIFVPEHAEGILPVMVWIHGGSYSTGGSGAKEEGSDRLEYEPAKYAVETGTVTVTINYRLNLYGFLNLHFLSDRFDQNCGLFDQVMALQYIHENIDSFGGDPDNVTLFGQSAGGACILALMTMPEATGLFHKCIVQSACIEHFFTEEESRKNTRLYLKTAGIREQNVEEILSLNKEQLETVNRKYDVLVMAKGEIRCSFSPVIDGITLKEEVKTAVKRSEIPLLIGNVMEEGNLFIRSIPEAIMPVLAEYMKIPVLSGKGNRRQRLSDALTEHIYKGPMREILLDYHGPAWCYEYQYVTPSLKEKGLGCCHACEVPVLFDMTRPIGNSEDAETKKVGHDMRMIWGRFAKEGNPGWKQYPEERYMICAGSVEK